MKKSFRDRRRTNKKAPVYEVNKQLTQSILLGDAPDRAINAITKKFGMEKSKAPGTQLLRFILGAGGDDV